MNYNQNDINSIIGYSKKLIGNTLRDLCGNDINEQHYKGKGNFGQFLERYYFQYEPNSFELLFHYHQVHHVNDQYFLVNL